MTSVVRLAGIGLVRAPLPDGDQVVVLGMAAALLGAMVLFVGQSLRNDDLERGAERAARLAGCRRNRRRSRAVSRPSLRGSRV